MKRSITRWTMALATAGVLGLPVTGFAGTAQDPAPQQQPQPQPQQQPEQQQPQPTPQPAQPQPQPQPTPQPAQPQPQPTPQPQPNPPQPTASPAPQSQEQAVSPQEHLKQAQAALNSIEATSVPAKDRASLAQLKKHFTALERAGTSTATETPKAPGAAAPKQVNWGTEVAAIDKIITELLGNDAAKTPGATPPTPTGTAGTKAAGTMIDDATRAKLLDVRTHITAYAAGMAGGTSTPKTEAAMSADQPAPAANAPSATPAAAANAASPASSTPASSTPAASAAQAAPAQSPNPAQEPAQSAAAAPAGQSQADTEAAHKHLIAARDSLSQLTQLPAAAQLSGEARTQVSQLITNFNELITTKADWRASYQKVAANLNSLIGPDNGDAEAAPTATTGATAAPGAVGTAGTATVELDPAVRAKLVELRKNLVQFEKASGGVNAK